MKITYKWLKDFVDIDAPAEEVAEKLTNAGLEVEELIHQNKHLQHVRVGRITKIERHPDADRLQICQVDLGDEHVQIITTATNVFEGAVVPVSLPGADLANGIKIQKSKLRGVDSDGMFCSGEELGIDDSVIEGASINGILIFPDNFKIGQAVEEALGLNDVIFDVNITPNRPDCMSVIGIAREVCAIYGKKFIEPRLDYISLGDRASNYIDVERKTDSCSRYMAAVIKNVKIQKSPDFIRQRLFAVGIKSINSIVDLTNYVLIEMGQPLHTFDRKMIEGKTIVVRDGIEGEKLEVLNHNTYTLTPADIVIADLEKPMVIAGVIGGTNSCITDATKEVVLEAAVFDLKSVRLTSKRYGVRTDSSARFEKGVYFGSAEQGLKRFLHYVCELGIGDILGGYVDKYAEKPQDRVVYCNVEDIDKILGINVPQDDMKRILNGLGITTTIENGLITAYVPDYREDIENANDLAEEIIRIYGYDAYEKSNKALFAESTVTEGGLDDKTALERKIKSALANNGFFEAVNFSICPPDICEKLMISDNRRFMIKIANPLSDEISCLRTTMAHSMLSTLAYNFSVGNKQANLFEAGRTYLPKQLPMTELPVETNYISLGSLDMSFKEFKAVVELALAQTGLNYKLVRSQEKYLHPGVSADIIDEQGNKYGTFGQIHPLVAKNYDLPKTVMYGELNLDALIPFKDKKYSLKPISKFPIVERDIAIVVKEEIANADLMAAIKSACGKIFYEVKLFDIYRSAALGEGMKSLAYNIKLSDSEKTLTDQEVTEIVGKVLKALKFRYGATLR